MKLRNRKTGEIIELESLIQFDTEDSTYESPSIESLCEEWEDYEEPKDYWWISPVDTDVVHCVEDVKDEMDQYNKEIGNYFETKEEAEKAVEKLKAWKRLKDKGLRFTGVYEDYTIEFTAPKEEIGWYWCNGMGEDLDLLFGGEE